MEHALAIELFFFNSKTDYLPYYRNFRYKIDGATTLSELLGTIAADVEGYAYPKERTVVRINNIVVRGEMSVEAIAARFGTQLRIDPVSTFRAVRDLCIDDSDFMAKFALLEPYCDEEDRRYFEGLYAVHYASEAFAYNSDYIGDALIMLAARLAEKGSEHKSAILKIVGDAYCGMGLYEYEANAIPAYDLTQQVALLGGAGDASAAREENPAQQILETKFSVAANGYATELEHIVKGIGLARIEESIAHRFEGFNAAFYHGPRTDRESMDAASELLRRVGADEIRFSRSIMGCGEGLAKSASEIAYEKAGNILLDAFDSSADLFIVPDAAQLRMFDIRKCSKAVGREIDIQVMSVAQLAAVVLGYTDKKAIGLDKSGCNISFI